MDGAGIASEKLKLYGVQFHPEVDLSDNGRQMLRNFLFDVAKCKGSYTMKSREASCVQYIRDTVGDHKVLVCLSSPAVYQSSMSLTSALEV